MLYKSFFNLNKKQPYHIFFSSLPLFLFFLNSFILVFILPYFFLIELELTIIKIFKLPLILFCPLKPKNNKILLIINQNPNQITKKKNSKKNPTHQITQNFQNNTNSNNTKHQPQLQTPLNHFQLTNHTHSFNKKPHQTPQNNKIKIK